ncbi:hypothetical protein BCD67_05355 [Oscillatoriales cyanobacterium USR001]|nr:hypothetical protein BCD67_05355 [Oscillatoriales cyanobacterium USR001]
MKEKMAVTEFEKGNQLLQKGKLEEAIAAYRLAIELNPDISWYHHNLGEALAKLGKLEDAIAAFRRAIELKPDFSWSYHHLGDALAQQEQWEESATAFGKAIELNPEHFGTYVGLGNSLAKLGQLDDAIAAYRRAIELEPEADWIQYRLGEVLQQRTQLDLAEKIASYRQMIELNPDNVEAHHNLLQLQPDNWERWLQLGNILVKQGKLEDAIAVYRRVIEHNPDNPMAYYSLGECLAKLGQLEEAIAAYRQAIELSEQEKQKASTLEPTEDREEVIKRYRQAIEDNPDNISEYHKLLELEPDNQEVLLQLGQALVRQEQMEEAIALYRRLVELSPCEEYYQELGALLVKQEKWDDAISCYRRAINIDPNFALSYYQLGQILEDLMATQNPEKLWEIIQPVSIESGVAEGELIFIKDDDFLEENINLSDEEFCIVFFKTYFGRIPSEQEKRGGVNWLNSPGNNRKIGIINGRDIPEVKNMLHQSIISVCQKEIIAYYYKAIDLGIKNYHIYYRLAELLEKQHKYDQSSDFYRRAIEMNSSDIEIQLRLAKTLEKNGDFKEAIKVCKKILEIDPEWPEVVALILKLERNQGLLKRDISQEPVPEEKLSLSVVLPTYNRSKRLKPALESYLKTDRSDIEFIICDNNSTDETWEVVHSFMSNDKRIKYVKNPINLGANRNLFRGFLEAKSPLIMVLSDDDFITEGFISLVIWAFESHPTVGVVHNYQGAGRYDNYKVNPRGASLFQKGTREIFSPALSSMLITALTFRKDVINYNAWELSGSVFPQMSLVTDIVINYDLYILYSQTEYSVQNKFVFEETIAEQYTLLFGIKTHSMPWDWGVPELVNMSLKFTDRLFASHQERWGNYQLYFKSHLVPWVTEHIFRTWYLQDQEGKWIFLGELLHHPHIRFSLIFWSQFLASALRAPELSITDKISIILLGCFMLIWRLIIYLRELTDPGLADLYYVGNWPRIDTPQLKHPLVDEHMKSQTTVHYSPLTAIRNLDSELET